MRRWTSLRSSPAISGQSFDQPPEGRAAGERLYHLRQETRSAQGFALEVRTLADGTGWNNRALIDHYRCSLREDVRRELACRDTTLTFDQLMDLSIRLDNLLATRGRPDRGLVVPSSRTPSPIPMELGGAVRGRQEGVHARVPSVAAEVTLPVGAGLVPLESEAAGRALWRHPR